MHKFLWFAFSLAWIGTAMAGVGGNPAPEKAVYQGKAVLKTKFSSTPGTLSVLPHKLLFEALDRTESREWPYDALRYVAWKGPGKIEVKTGERDAKMFGKKKTYTFLIDTPPFPEETANWINEQVGAATGEKIAPAGTPDDNGLKWPVVRPAEHQHSFGGCSGSLVLTPEAIDYQARDSDHSVHLSYMDIKEINRKSPFHLEIVTFKKSAKKLWMSQNLEFQIQGDGLPDNVYQYMLDQIRRNEQEEK